MALLLQALGFSLAVAALALLPCVAVFVLFADSFHSLTPAWLSSLRRRGGTAPAAIAVAGPPLETIAADLHRVSLTRLMATPGSTLYIAATRAYDHHLAHACRALGIPQHLSELEDLDLDLERMRVEHALSESGFVLLNDPTRLA